MDGLGEMVGQGIGLIGGAFKAIGGLYEGWSRPGSERCPAACCGR